MTLEAATVTVVIPTYQRKALLSRALQSVREQTWPCVEVIVVDDASPQPVVFDDVKVVRHARNLGPGAARNTGISHASGAFITFLDDDDWFAPDRLRWAMEGIGDRRSHACQSATVHPDGRFELGSRRFIGDMTCTLMHGQPPHVSQVVCRREDVVPMDPTLRTTQDVEWWSRMTHAADFAWTEEIGHFFRIHDGPRHGRPSPLAARQVIVLRQWATADARARARMANRLAAAYGLEYHGGKEVWWRLKALIAQPSSRQLRLLAGRLRVTLKRIVDRQNQDVRPSAMKAERRDLIQRCRHGVLGWVESARRWWS